MVHVRFVLAASAPRARFCVEREHCQVEQIPSQERALNMGMIQEFKEFAMRGNVVDLAVGVIMGAAFGPIVSTLVNNIIMPPIGLAMRGVDFAQSKILLQAADAAAKTPEIAIGYGMFINTIINFLITAFAIFILVKAINHAKARFEKEKAAVAAAAPPRSEMLLEEIRNALIKK
jgi:large conductance mechanosensitive channel